MTDSHIYIGKLNNWLQAWSQGKLKNGRLDVAAPQGQWWSLYFHLGHLIGAAGGAHPVRRWYRQLSQYCPQLDLNPVRMKPGKGHQCWDYESLAELIKQGQILRQQMLAVVQGSIAEVCFDILQQEQMLRDRSLEQLTYTYTPEETLYNSPLIFIQPDRAWQQAQQAWESWRQAGLEVISPNMAPTIWQPEKLQQQTSLVTYHSLITLVDGKRTLRDLALKLRQEPLPVTLSIIPFVQTGVMKLLEVADVGDAVTPPTVAASQPMQARSTAPLVAYIDDSPRDSQIMGQILTKAGYRYVNLQDSVLALPTLLENKPALIFLDLVMPIANGYEICAQIRRTSMLRDTPVIIFTGNDGIIDRVRAKMVGSTEFLAKPIEPKKVLTTVRKYLSVPKAVEFRIRDTQNF